MESLDMLLSRRQMLRGLGIAALSVGAGVGLLSCDSSPAPVTVVPSPTPTLPPASRAGAPTFQVRSKLSFTGPAFGVAFSPNSKNLVTAGLDKDLRIWSAVKGTTVLNTLSGFTDAALSVAYSPDGSKIVAGSLQPAVGVWDNAKNQSAPLFTDTKQTDRVNSVACRPMDSIWPLPRTTRP